MDFLTPEQQATILNVVATALMLVLTVVVPMLATVITQAAKAWWATQKDAQLKSIVETTVKMVEQVYGSLDGDTRKAKAIALAQARLNEIGFGPIDLAELDILIEAAVKQMKMDSTPAITVIPAQTLYQSGFSTPANLPGTPPPTYPVTISTGSSQT